MPRPTVKRIDLLNALRYGALFYFLLSCASTRIGRRETSAHPKREFRGAWIQTVYQEDYRNLTSKAFRALMNERLDRLQDCGINALFFQVRPEADAFYHSKYEPWSRFLTGRQGTPPDEPDFDPMTFLIDACHRRNMEFHAWLNPYRACTGRVEEMAAEHVYYQHPEWFVTYNGQLFFDPGVPDCRQFICRVVKDIVARYDVDAIHMDDYFYPYPANGQKFPDDASFRLYGYGYTPEQRDDWRRENVNRLIYELKRTILVTKPWVRFGISPFGIYRNRSSDRYGSLTAGLQNYDDLYADVLLWMQQGWIDYCVPQLYWEVGHPSADYLTLIRWWSEQPYNTPLYIGQDVARTMKAGQLRSKMDAARAMEQVQGNVFWPANELLWNSGRVADSLRNVYHRYPALIPAYTHLHERSPEKVKRLRIQSSGDEDFLVWDAPPPNGDPERGAYFVVYRFRKGERIDLNRSSAIYAITREPYCRILSPAGRSVFVYAVTAVDRFHNESKKRRIVVRIPRP